MFKFGNYIIDRPTKIDKDGKIVKTEDGFFLSRKCENSDNYYAVAEFKVDDKCGVDFASIGTRYLKARTEDENGDGLENVLMAFAEFLNAAALYERWV